MKIVGSELARDSVRPDPRRTTPEQHPWILKTPIM
jgi:hypothetical protein